LESDPYAVKNKTKNLAQQLSFCLRFVYSYAVLMPAYKLINTERAKLNLNFVMEYHISSQFDQKNDFNHNYIKEKQLGSIVSDIGVFSVKVYYLFDYTLLPHKRANVIEIITDDYSGRRERYTTDESSDTITPPSFMAVIINEDSRFRESPETTSIKEKPVQQQHQPMTPRTSQHRRRRVTAPTTPPQSPRMIDDFIIETPPSPSFPLRPFNPFRQSKEAHSFPEKNTTSDIKSATPSKSETYSRSGDDEIEHEDMTERSIEKINDKGLLVRVQLGTSRE